MTYIKNHPAHSWVQEATLATADVNCAVAQLESVNRQVDEVNVQIKSAEEVIRALEPSPDRRVKAEVAERKRHLNQLTRRRESILNSQRIVEARLKRYQENLDALPKAELQKEIALANAKHRVGSIGSGPDPVNELRASAAPGSVTNY
jgi:chromosome segregation ATPase